MWLILLCLAGVGLGRLQTSARNSGTYDPISLAVTTAVNPLRVGFTHLANGISDFTQGLFSAGSLKRENEELKKLTASAKLYDSRILELQREVDSLRNLMKFANFYGRKSIPAEVIGYAPNENQMTISAGRKHQVREGLPVVSSDGLLGKVQAVGPDSAQVLLVTSPWFKIGAIVQRDPPSAGLLHGEAADRLIIEFMDLNAPVQIGDLVLTSGFSKQIPRGIPIGKVVQVQKDENFGRLRGQVYPNVQIGSVREVFVLR